MKKNKELLRKIIIIIFLMQIISCNLFKPKPPVAEKIPYKLTKHNHTRIDNYYWMKNRDNPEVKKYLEAENKYIEKSLKHLNNFRDKIFNEIVNRIKQDDETVPVKENGYWYYIRYEEGKEYPVFCRKKESLDSAEQILLNGNEMAKDYKYFNIGALDISPDNIWMGYSVDTVSRRLYTMYFKNLLTGHISNEKIPNCTDDLAWANDNKTVFYTVKDTNTLRKYKIMKHVVGTDPANDVIVYEEKDESYIVSVYKSKSKKYIIIGSYATLTSEIRLIDANKPESKPVLFQPRQKEVEYHVFNYGNMFYILTNYKAPNFRVMKCEANKTKKEFWKEVIPNRNDAYINEIELFKDFMVVSERKDGLNQLRIINLKNNSEYYIEFGEETYDSYIGKNPEFDTEWLRYGYTSLTVPTSVYDFNMRTCQKILKKQQPVLGDFKPENYESKRIFAKAGDGTKIPISIVYKKNITPHDENPLLLTAYGSYGYVTDPYFSVARLSLLDRGFIYAIAHVRGGSDFGRLWYEQGRLLNKMNTFTDFISCALHLINEKYTSKEKLCIMGGSAGGLLIGAVLNLKPDIFKAAIAEVPFVDVLTTMLDESIPLTTGEYDEWGNPNIKKYYDYMLTYSPYDNVQAKNYPALLVTTGFYDSQVQYWEPAKWVAKLRALKTDNNPIYLYTDMSAGHGGASGRFQQYKEIALDYVFLFDQLGIKK
jgi:oligopeptidase B